MASFRELLKATRAEIREVDTAGGEQLLAAGSLLLDERIDHLRALAGEAPAAPAGDPPVPKIGRAHV